MTVDEYGFTSVKNKNFLNTNESFILFSQARHVFHLKDNIDPTRSIVLSVEFHKRFIVGGQMSGPSVDPYQEGGMCCEQLTFDLVSMKTMRQNLLM